MAKHNQKSITEGTTMASTLRWHTFVTGLGLEAPCVSHWVAWPQTITRCGLWAGAHTSHLATSQGIQEQRWISGLSSIDGLSHKWRFWHNSDLMALKWWLTKEKWGRPSPSSNIGHTDASDPNCQMLDGTGRKCFKEPWKTTRNETKESAQRIYS